MPILVKFIVLAQSKYKDFLYIFHATQEFKNLVNQFLSESNIKNCEITSDEKLIGVLTGQWGDYGLTPKESSFAMHCAIAGHYFDGANYPIGGSRSIAESIVPVIQNHGGQIFVSSGVDKIYIKNKKLVF